MYSMYVCMYVCMYAATQTNVTHICEVVRQQNQSCRMREECFPGRPPRQSLLLYLFGH